MKLLHTLLHTKILEKIAQNGGEISFFDYMNMVLYEPGCGYYTGNTQQFGQSGDFVTAPEISPLFGQCIAKVLQPVLENLDDPIIIELGAGTGSLAQILLDNHLKIKNYIIVEISPALRKLQQERLANYGSKVLWINDINHIPPVQGVILANEVMDALPVMRFCWKNKNLYEYFVGYNTADKCFFPKLKKINKTSQLNLKLIKNLNLPDNYSSEFHLDLESFIKNLSKILLSGLVLLLDYGFARHEFYHPDRKDGTLMCHHKHQSNTDPFYLPGCQDITAHVDFTAVADYAFDAGFEVAGYTSQAAFLLSLGITEMAKTYEDNNAVKMLTLPSEMGELIKVMCLSKNINNFNKSIPGFKLQDMRYKLYQ